MICPVHGIETRKIIFGHEWCDECHRAIDINGPRPFALFDVFKTDDLTVAHAHDIRSRRRINDGPNGEHHVERAKPATLYFGGACG